MSRVSEKERQANVQAAMDRGVELVNKTRKDVLFVIKEREKQGVVLKKSFRLSTFLRIKGSVMYQRKVHDKATHVKILSLYSESIAFGPKNSEELALAYSSRSELLLHLHCPKNSFIDIAKALQITKSTNLRTELSQRKAHCLKLIEKSTDTSDKLEIPAFTPSTQLPCAANCIEIARSPQFGRHMVATRDIEPGEVICAETGYAAFPRGNNLYLNCSHCLRLALNGIPCDSCAFVIFCSETCKREAWNAYHDIECRIIRHIFVKGVQKSVNVHTMTATRILLTAAKREGIVNVIYRAKVIDTQDFSSNVQSNEELNCATFKRCYTLLSHEELTKLKEKIIYTRDIQFQVNLVLNLLYEYTDIFNDLQQETDSHGKSKSALRYNAAIYITLESILRKLRNIVSFSNYGYGLLFRSINSKLEAGSSVMPGGIEGLMIAPCSNFINHSCYPNVIPICMPKRKIVMMTVFPVKKGEQLYINYGALITKEKQKRQKFLQDNYYFTCECEVCRNDWTVEHLCPPAPLGGELDTTFKFLRKFYKKNSCRLYGKLQDWPIDAEGIEEAKEVCKLFRKNLKYHDALRYSLKYVAFLESAFVKLYEEKRNLPLLC